MNKQSRMTSVLSSLLPDIGQAIARFPVSVVIAALFTSLHLVGMSDLLGLESEGSLRLSLALVLGFLWAFASGLAGEAKGWSPVLRYGVVGLGVALFGLASALLPTLDFQPFLALPALLIGAGLSPYMVGWRTQENAAFWQFNHRLWLGAGLALFGAVLFAGGLSIIIETIEALFDIAMPDSAHEKIWTLGLGLVAPVNWLTLAPADFAEPAEEGAPAEFTARATATIVKYILAPLVLIYTAILYSYAVKIAIDGALPKGRVGPLVLGYGAVGTISVLLAYPVRADGGPLVAALWRHWFWLILVPVGLLFMALYQRIAQYGWTEERYLVALAGVWLIALALVQGLSGRLRDLRLAPALLAALLMLASIGPWGARGVALTSQVGELVRLLEAEGRLAAGKIVVAPATPLSNEAQARIRSIVRYLARNNELAALDPWFEGGKRPRADDTGPRQRERALLAALGVRTPLAPKLPGGPDALAFSAQTPGAFDVSGFGRIAGPISFVLHPGQAKLSFQIGHPRGSIGLEISFQAIIVLVAEGTQVRFDMAAVLQDFRGHGGGPRLLRREHEGRGAALLFEELRADGTAGGLTRLNGRVWVFVVPPGN